MRREAQPQLIVLIGLPGAGKTTLARALCRAKGYIRVDRDAIRAAMFPRGRATDAEKRAANRSVWNAAALLLRQRQSIVIDGMTFARAAERRRARSVARRAGARYLEIFLDCPVPLAQRRVKGSSTHPAPDRDAELVAEVAARFDPVSRRALRLDARIGTAAQLRLLLAVLA